MDDMLHIIHEQGFKGKIWRLTKVINTDLTAKVKTKMGLTREIKRVKGGKQGGKLMVPLFSKLMDTLPDDLAENPNLGINIDDLIMSCLEYVDDVITFAIGYPQQESMLAATNEFAVKRQMEWGQEKCQVMEVGSHKEKRDKWKLGSKTIEKCNKYKYLGEEISRDGKSKENLIERFKKVKQTVRAVMSCGKSEVMKKIETKVLLQLHETVTLPTLLSNAETWILDAEERKETNKMEIWALKQMIGLPVTTPTPAVIFATGSLYTSIRIDKVQLIYLHTLLNKEIGHWATKVLMTLNRNNLGWAKRINELLCNWTLETDWETISKKSRIQWKIEVTTAAEKMNIKLLKEQCHIKEHGNTRQKTKTKTILQKLDQNNYIRKPLEIMNHGSILATRALIMGRYGMLNCRANFSKGSGGKNCVMCNTVDDESHRINDCIIFREINLYDSDERVDYDLLYSDDVRSTLKVVKVILKMWDLGHGKNAMRL